MWHELFSILIGLVIFLSACFLVGFIKFFIQYKKNKSVHSAIPDNKKTADGLLAELTTALEHEHYERAAQIRDELNSRKKITNE